MAKKKVGEPDAVVEVESETPEEVVEDVVVEDEPAEPEPDRTRTRA